MHAWAEHFDALGVEQEPVREMTDPMPLALVLLRDPNGIVIELIWTGA